MDEGKGLFRELETAVEAKRDEGELPGYMAEELLAVARDPGRYGGEEGLVAELLEEVREFSVYADTGCCKFGFDHEDVGRTLRRLRERVGQG